MLAATVLALVAAALHAAWNLLVKTSAERDLTAWGQFLFGGLLVIPVLFVIGWPDAVVLPYLAGSALVHVAYVIGLVAAYTHGDFSFAYPLARGGGALVAALGGVLLLSDHLSAPAWLAIAIVAGGLASLIRPGTSRLAILWAGFTAVTIGIYTLIDSAGARAVSGDAMVGVRYGFALMPCTAITISVANVARGRTRAFVDVLPRLWPKFLVAAVFLTAAYTLVLVAVRIPGVQVGYVTVLRESSIVMGAAAGWLLLHERLGKHRLISSCVIVTGMILLIVVNLSSA